MTTLCERRDPLPFKEREIAPRVIILITVRRSKTAILLAPSKAGLPAYTDLSTCLHGAHAGGQ